MPNRRFNRFAWFFVAYMAAVILFGAWVRITGSGAGCGSHWPACQGEIIPPSPGTQTLIEYTHRLTSGLCGILGIALVIWARRVSPRLFRAALATLFFLIVESLIGAVLVKKELVAGDASASRAVVIGLHLTNTMLLTACAATVAWWSGSGGAMRIQGARRAAIAASIAALLFTNVSGAITALGDTLFPAQPALGASIFAKVRDDLSASQHFLVRLRLVHPVVAVLTAVLLATMYYRLLRGGGGPQFARLVKIAQIAVLSQVALGVINIMLAAPGWMQIVHLLAAQVVWLTLWLITLSAWRAPQISRPS
jgi:heme A synthase